MQTASNFEWDDFDRHISEALAIQGARPPDWVWQRILDAASNPDRMGGYVTHGDDEFPVSPELVELVT